MGSTFQRMGWEDREVRVNRAQLIEILKKNREQHIADYKGACEGYRQKALERIDQIYQDLKKNIDDLKSGQFLSAISLHFGLSVPVSHEKSYDQIVAMMEMSVDDTILLTASQFGCFVLDDWEWKGAWTTANEFYWPDGKRQAIPR